MYKLIIFFYFIFTNLSHAYLGPGMGAGILTATLGVILAILALIFGVIWFPLKRLIKRKKEKKASETNKID